VKFIKVDVEKVEEVAQARNISAMPTFQFFVRGEMVDEIKGANPPEIEAKVAKWQVDTNPFAGKGQTLGAPTGDADQPPLDPRAARLKALERFGGGGAGSGGGGSGGGAAPPSAPAALKPAAAPATSSSVPMAVDDDDDAIARAVAASLTDPAAASSSASSSSSSAAPMDVEKPTSGSGSAAATALKKSAAEQDAADIAEAEALILAEDDAAKAADDAIWGEEMGACRNLPIFIVSRRVADTAHHMALCVPSPCV